MKYIYLLNDYLKKFINGQVANSDVVLPKKILGYTFVVNLRPQKNYPFSIGKYKDEKGREVVVKLWSGDSVDHNLLNLEREARVLKALTDINDKNLFDTGKYQVKTPAYIGIYRTSKRFALIMEYVGDERLSHVTNSKVQKKYFVSVIEYLQKISTAASNKEVSSIGNKSLFTYLWQMPIIFTLAVKNNPLQRRKLFQSLFLFLKYYSAVISETKKGFVHGDVHIENIHISQDKIFILDLEQSRKDLVVNEFITGISRKNSSSINKYLKNAILSQVKNNNANLASFVVAGTSHIIHSLSENLDKQSLEHYLDVLEFVIRTEKKYKHEK